MNSFLVGETQDATQKSIRKINYSYLLLICINDGKERSLLKRTILRYEKLVMCFSMNSTLEIFIQQHNNDTYN